MATQQSTVKWFDAKKGYGLINHPDGGDDVFVHYTQIESDKDFKTLRTGQEVEFEMSDGPKGLHALKVNAIGEGEESSSPSENSLPASSSTSPSETAKESSFSPESRDSATSDAPNATDPPSL